MKNIFKKRLLGIPILIIGGILVLSSVALAAYLVQTITGNVAIQEAITMSPTDFSVSMYPNETYNETVTVSNAGSQPIDVSIEYSVDPVTDDITVEFDGLANGDILTVPAEGFDTFDINVIAANDSAPDVSYVISISISR